MSCPVHVSFLVAKEKADESAEAQQFERNARRENAASVWKARRGGLLHLRLGLGLP